MESVRQCSCHNYVPRIDDKQQLPQVPVSIKLIFELEMFKDQNPGCTFRTFYGWIQSLFGETWPEENPPTLQAFTKSVERLKAKLAKLKKQHSSSDKEVAISGFLKENYTLPKFGVQRGRVLHFSPVKQIVVEEGKEDKAGAKKNMKTREYQQKLYAIARNTNKRIRRRDQIIEDQKQQLISQKKNITAYQKQIDRTECRLSKLKAELGRVNDRASYWKSKIGGIKHGNSTKINELRTEVKKLKEAVSSLESDNVEMNEQVESLLSSDEIVTFKKGKYTDDVRACIYELLSLNVGVRNITPAINCVLKNLAKKSIGRLPSYGLTCQMIIESLTIVQAQMGETLSKTESFSTLQTDGTTKFGEHYGTYDVRVNESETVYTLGMRHVFSGTAKNTLETFKEILEDIDSVQLALGKECASSKIIAKIKNTMSDRHSAEKLFNELLENYRADILPSVAENWIDLTAIEKDQLTCMNNFFCGLHYVVGLAEGTEEVLKQWESQSLSTEISGPSGTQRLVRTACKAFHHRGSQQCGSSVLFRTYLRKLGITKIPLAHFVGNRFNILFYDAAGVIFLRKHMDDFIESAHGKEANRLLRAVLSDLRNPIYISGCRALGLIDKIVTGPLWRKLQESSISVLKMGAVYCELKERFELWSNDAHDVVDGSARLANACKVHIDEVWDTLTQSHGTESDAKTQEVLQLLFAAFSITTGRMLIDHLPGGKYHSDNVTGTGLVEETATVPTTNVDPERDFAVLDRMLREKPNASTVALESFILYSHNRTTHWLEQQSSHDKEKLFQMARTLAPSIREKFKLRTLEILKQREESLAKKQQAIAAKQARIIREKEKLTKDVEQVGLWLNRGDIGRGLKTVKNKTEITRLLKLQINFRHKVLGQTHSDISVFRFSQSGRKFTNDELKDNLHQLLPTENDDSSPTKASLDDIVKQPQLLVGLRIKHRFEEDGQMIWFLGTVKHFCAQSKMFTVLYDDELETCNFSLLDDIISGDLLIL